ncbi:MAG: hypothetical protein CSA96_06565 [Bacteroidetes bacterium]|nr:MAG: hypothetical protein CSA96_06565 [Bacteroidota bacterium]
MIKKVVFVLVMLLSLKFFNLVVFPEVVFKLAEWIALALILLLLVLFVFYGREEFYKLQFWGPILLIMTGMVLSMFGASAFQGQSVGATAYAQKVLYFYLFYFLLHFLKLEGEFIIRVILALGVSYILIYLIQYNLYPVQISSAKMFIDRGTLRIFMPGAGFFVISYFIWLYLAFRTFRFKYLVFLLLSLVVLVLLGTRQMLAAMILLTIVFILQSKVIKSKFLIFILGASIALPVFFMFQDVFLEMLDVTRDQSESVDSNIRVLASRFFLTDFMPTPLSYITGNGASDGHSAYGRKVIYYMEHYHFFQSDVGLIGEYTQYGAFFVLGVIVILVRALRKKLPEKLRFIKFNFLGILLTLVTGAGAFGSVSTNILINCTMLYLIDLYSSNDEAFSAYPFLPQKKSGKPLRGKVRPERVVT